jgi:hypothetical protein
MAAVTKIASASMDASTGMFAVQTTDLIAGEDLAAVDACYIKTSDGKVYRSLGTSDVEAAEFVGFVPRATKLGQPCTLFSIGARFRYGTSLSPGAVLFVGLTAGALADAVTAGGRTPIARVIDDTDIQCIAAYSTSVNT